MDARKNFPENVSKKIKGSLPGFTHTECLVRRIAMQKKCLKK